MNAEEEARALEYRRQMVRRRANEKARAARQTGDPAARAQLERNWAPLICALREKRYATRQG